MARLARLAVGLALGAVLPAFAQPSAALDLFVKTEKGYCIACHQLPQGVGPETRSDVGPVLTGERMRALGREAIREIIRDPTRRNPQTLMPPFGTHRILEPAEIDRLADFLHAMP